MTAGRRDIPSQSDPRYVRPPDEAYELDTDPSYRQHQAVNNIITQSLIDRLTGSGAGEKRHFGSKPSRQYFAGVLASQYDYMEAMAQDDSFEDIAEDVAPFSIGLQFRVPADIADDAAVELTPSASVYYRRFPTVEEQRERGEQAASPTDAAQSRSGIGAGEEAELETDGGVATASDDAQETQSFLPAYERLPVEFDDLVLTGERLRELAEQSDEEEIDLNETLQNVAETALEDDRYFCDVAEGVKQYDARVVPVDVLEDDNSFNEWIDQHYGNDQMEPLWEADLRVRVDRDDDELVINASLVNTHGTGFPDATDYQYKMWRAFLFNVGVEAAVNDTSVIPFRLDEIRDKYQYDGRMYAIGENCAAEPTYPEEARNPLADPEPTGVQTATLPVYKQAKYLPREPIPARFDVLAGQAELQPDEIDPKFDIDSPIGLDGVLRLIEEQMAAAEEDYEAIREEVLEHKSDEAETQFDDALEDFRTERQRFHQGRKLIENDERVRQAFKFLNETFTDELLGDFSSWRLFQIVFIVMTIPDMVKQANPERDVEEKLDTADVIYYPTGGGKTESYLGLVTFTAFHDRLRGKHYGTTALTKFPLRFLSLDQLERAAEVLGQAELVRRDHGIDGEPFSVGYFVGSNNTPNKLMNQQQYDREDRIEDAKKSPSNENEEHEYLILSECPFCGEESVEIDGDHEQARIYHRCTNAACPWVSDHDGAAAELPVYISDREIFRHAPTFVVSTIDKISIMGMQRRFRTLLGAIQTRCPDHGFSGEEQCLVDDYDYPDKHTCDNSDLESVEQVDPPSLIIQDELHLLREEFGSFDSHYETLLQTLADRLNDGWDVKVVAATATIQGAERQVEALYRKEDNIFPAQGPRLKQSFYAYAHPRRVGRNMIGGIPRNVTRSRAINRIHEEQTRIVQNMMQNPERLLKTLRNPEGRLKEFEHGELGLPSEGEGLEERLLSILDNYEVQISYHYAKDNTQLMKRSVRTMINSNLEAAPRDYEPLNAKLMTGETPLNLVRSYKDEIEKPREERENPIHTIIATSMISHGIDIDRFNFISFHGMPRSTAEYIQSYSRVGRSVPGTVYLSFNPMQVRDRSHYHQFHHYHEYEDLLVEATPLERWAKYAIEQTISGVLCAALLQYYDFKLANEISGRLYDLKGLQEAFHEDLLTKQDVKRFLLEAYDVGDADEDATDAAAIYADRIDDLFDTLWQFLLAEDDSGNTFIPSVLERGQEDDSLPGVRRPMTNLRDIDEQIPIEPDTETAKSVHLFNQ
jgi:hypothetical protein